MTDDAAPSLTELINRQLGRPPDTPLVRGTESLRAPEGQVFADEPSPDAHEDTQAKRHAGLWPRQTTRRGLAPW